MLDIQRLRTAVAATLASFGKDVDVGVVEEEAPYADGCDEITEHCPEVVAVGNGCSLFLRPVMARRPRIAPQDPVPAIALEETVWVSGGDEFEDEPEMQHIETFFGECDSEEGIFRAAIPAFVGRVFEQWTRDRMAGGWGNPLNYLD